MLPQDAVKRLIEGNERFVNDLTKSPNRTSYRREEVKGKQNPFAVMITPSVQIKSYPVPKHV